MAMSVARALTEELNNYTPCVLEIGNNFQEKMFLRMLSLIKIILQVSSQKFSRRQQEKIITALRFSAKNHAGIRRKDNVTPYFMHLLEVVYILLDMKVYDYKIIVSAILHDVVEDTTATLRQIGTIFGAAIKNIVDLMTKHPNFVRKWRYWSLMKEEPDLNCRWRVIVLKFADRIHNLMTLDAIPEEKRKEKLDETVREFPSLYKVLASTFEKLYRRGTLKNKQNRFLPFRLNNRLIYEMGRYT